MLKRLVNHSEEVVRERLRAIVEQHGALVYAKLRVADVIELDKSGVSVYWFSVNATRGLAS